MTSIYFTASYNFVNGGQFTMMLEQNKNTYVALQNASEAQ